MPRKCYSSDQIITHLREAEVELAKGQPTAGSGSDHAAAAGFRSAPPVGSGARTNLEPGITTGGRSPLQSKSVPLPAIR